MFCNVCFILFFVLVYFRISVSALFYLFFSPINPQCVHVWLCVFLCMQSPLSRVPPSQIPHSLFSLLFFSLPLRLCYPSAFLFCICAVDKVYLSFGLCIYLFSNGTFRAGYQFVTMLPFYALLFFKIHTKKRYCDIRFVQMMQM